VVCSYEGEEHAYESAPDAKFRELAFSKSRAHFQGLYFHLS
jgi:hypothetical protein